MHCLKPVSILPRSRLPRSMNFSPQALHLIVTLTRVLFKCCSLPETV